MKFAAFYDESGTVKYVFGFPEDSPPPNDKPWVEVNSPVMADDGCVRDGAWVAYTPEGAARKAVPPLHPATWNPGAEQWVDARTPDALKADKWAEIKAARDAAEHGGFTWDGSVFDSDPESQTKIVGATQLANMNPASFLMDWTLKDNTVRTLTGAQMISVGQALAVHVNAQHVLGRTLRQQIEAATTAAEVNAIHWPDDTP
jgi:hypothetical protein